ncbi:MAG: protein kinase [Chloroflexi bacterium]|nr:protein kinase [Chloroflexota bacterium]
MEGRLVRDRYRLDERLGEGTMGTVYRAFDLAENRVVAIKVAGLAGYRGAWARFQREAQAMLVLHHPHIVEVYDAGQDGDLSFIIMEYLSGTPLRQILPLAVPEAIEIAVQIGSALAHAHGRGIIHRDIKPANLMVSRTGNTRPGFRVKVMDLGLALRLGDQFDLSEAGVLVGTAAYVSPEQALGHRIDARSDLYSLGAVLYEMLTGQCPFPGDNFVSVIYQHLNEAPPSPRGINPAVPQSLEQVILRLLRKDPSGRFASAEDLIASLSAIQRELASAVRPQDAPASQTASRPIATGAPLVGREHELRLLTETIRQARGGPGRFVLLAGEQGIGKTRLALEAVAFARLHRFQVASATCYQQEGRPPYQPFTDAIRDYANGLNWQDLEVLRQATAGYEVELLSLVPELARVYGEPLSAKKLAGGLDQERTRLFEAVRQLISAISQLSPVLLFIDDLQWADTASLQMLRYVGRHTLDLPVLILGTYRSAEVSPQLADLLSQMESEQLHRLIALTGLSPEQSGSLMRCLLGSDTITGELHGKLYAATEGNPFFIVETIRHLLEDGSLVKEDGRWRFAAPQELQISPGVKQIVERRLGHLSRTAREILAVAAVIGRAFSPSLLRLASSSPEAGLASTVDMALASGLLRERSQGQDGGIDFGHGLIREVLYAGLPASRKRLLHRRVAQALEARCDADNEMAFGELAYHYSRGGRPEKAAEYGVLAGRQAAAVYASEEAFRYFDAARELVEKHGLKTGLSADIMEGLGRMAIILGRFGVAVKSFKQAIRDIESQAPLAGNRVAKLRGELSAAYERLGDYDEALRQLQQGLAGIGALQTVESAYLHGQLAVIYTRRGDMDLALSHAERDLGIAELLGDEEEIAQACTILYKIQSLRGDWDGARKLTERALQIWIGRGDIYRQEWNYLNLGTALWALGRWEEARENWLRSLEISHSIHYLQGIVQNDLNLGLLGLRRGELDQAEELLAEALALAREIGHRFYAARATMRMAELKAQQGESAAAMAAFAEAEQALRQLGHKTGLSELLWLKADACADQGLLDEAEQAAVESLDLAPQPDGYEEIGNASRALARVWLARGDHQRAGEYLERAEACMDRLEDAYGKAQLQLDLATFLAESGLSADLAKAKALVAEARAIFSRLHAQPQVERAKTIARKIHRL